MTVEIFTIMPCMISKSEYDKPIYRDIGFLSHMCICIHYVDLWFILYIVIIRFLLLPRIYFFILCRYITKRYIRGILSIQTATSKK